MPVLEPFVVATFDTNARAEAAVRRLQVEGLDVRALSIVAKGLQVERQALGLVTVAETMRRQTSRAGSWGALWGLIVGGTVVVPTLGPLPMVSLLVVWGSGGLVGAIIGATAGAVAAAILTSGPTAERAVKYGPAVRTGTYQVLSRNSVQVLTQARALLGSLDVAQTVPLPGSPTRQSVIALLDEEELAKVSTAVSAEALSEGDEYLDLEQLHLGVLHAHRLPEARGGVLPRKAVPAGTWLAVLEHLHEAGVSERPRP